LISLAVAFIIVYRTWRYRTKPPAAAFLAGMMLLGGWSLAVFMEKISTNFTAQIFWNKLAFTFAVFLPSAWILFTLLYTERIKTVRTFTPAVLAVIPVLLVGAVWTNDIWHLMWQSVWWNTAVSPPVIVHAGGIFSQVYTCFNGALVFLVTGGFFVSFLRAPTKYIKYIGTIMLAMVTLWIPVILDIAGSETLLNMNIGFVAYAATSVLLYRTMPGIIMLQSRKQPEIKYKNVLSGLTVFETEVASAESRQSGFRVPDMELPETSDHFYSDYYPSNGINLN